MKRQKSLLEFCGEEGEKVKRSRPTVSPSPAPTSTTDSDSDGFYDQDNCSTSTSILSPGETSSTTTSSTSPGLSSSNASMSTGPSDIAHDRHQSPVQPILRSFPLSQVKGQKRSFNSSWYKTYPFLEYSVKEDAVYCFPCRLFPSPTHKAETTFTEKGLRNWKKFRSKVDKHMSSETHKLSLTLWCGYQQTRLHGSVGEQLDAERRKMVQDNRVFLTSICKVAVLCARQDIGLRGHLEGEGSHNRGNFLEILDVVAAENSVLRKRIENSPGNAKYTSKTTQNDLLKAASATIVEQIVEEIKRAEFYSIIADETRDISRIEQLSLCLRYVHPDDHSIKERFLGFTDCPNLDASSLAEQIVSQLHSLGLSLMRCVAQCYDGASVMSGHLSGVQKHIRDEAGSGCVYVHCYAHRLNLVVVNTASSISKVSEFFGVMEAVYRFITASTLRHDKFVDAQKDKNLKVMEIPKLSDTRWVCRYVAVRLFKERYDSLLHALENITEQSHNGCEKAESIGLLHQLQSFTFILLLWIFDDVLGITKILSDTLQGKELDLARAMELVKSVQETLTERRSQSYFDQIIWPRATQHANSSDIDIISDEHDKRKSSVPTRLQDALILAPLGKQSCITGSVAAGFRVLYFSILDRILSELHRRFDESRSFVLAVAACNPKSKEFLKLTIMMPLVEECPDAIDVTNLESQLAVAQNLTKRSNLETTEEFYALLTSMQQAFPDLIRLIRIALTVPVTSATAERSFSALKRIKTYLRSTMGQERLSHIAVLSIERELSKFIDYDKVLNKFSTTNPRRIVLQ